MSLLHKSGIKALSQLVVDADKDWNGLSLTNVKEVTSDMRKGDLFQKGSGLNLVRLIPTNHGDQLTSNGLNAPLSFQAPPRTE